MDNSKGMRDYGSRRVSAGRVSPASAQAAIRRYGYVGQKMYEALVAACLHQGRTELAEDLGDEFKPYVDALVHFEVRLVRQVEQQEEEDVPPSAP